jgi:formylmethanofuran dehydrogenase subunit C
MTAPTTDTTVTLDAAALPMREVNRSIRAALAAGGTANVANPGARHNIGVALLSPGAVHVQGSAGYYCGGMSDGATITIDGSAGWGVAEGMLSGTVDVRGNAGMGAAASIRGGTVVVRGDCAARAGISMKGGLLLVGGNVGNMTGFMMQKGVIAICGDAGEGLADSMYEGTVFIAGEAAELGSDTVEETPTNEELSMLAAAFDTHEMTMPGTFRKIVAGRKLWNFSASERDAWREVL